MVGTIGKIRSTIRSEERQRGWRRALEVAQFERAIEARRLLEQWQRGSNAQRTGG